MLTGARAWLTPRNATPVYAASAVALPLAVAAPFGVAHLGALASLGGMTALYASGIPYRRRARTLCAVGAGLAAAMGLGSVGGLSVPAVAVAVAVAVVAVAATMLCRLAAIRPPAAYIFVLVSATATQLPADLPATGRRVGLVAAGAVVAWVVGMAGWVFAPDAPERRAVADAYRAAAVLLRAPDAGLAAARQAAAAALLTAVSAVAGGSRRGDPAGLRAALASLREASEAAFAARLGGPAGDDPAARARLAAALDEAAAALRPARRATRSDLSPAPPAAGAWQPVAAAVRRASHAAAGSAAPTGRSAAASTGRSAAASAGWRTRLGPAGYSAARAGCGVIAAAALAVMVGAPQPYWAIAACAAVLMIDGSRTTVRRAAHRTTGTVVGVALTAALFAADLPLPATILAVAVLQYLAELLMPRHYGAAVVFVTPLALLLAELATNQSTSGLLGVRLVDTALGCAAALAVGLLVFPRAAGNRLSARLLHATESINVVRGLQAGGSEPTSATGAHAALERHLHALSQAASAASNEWILSRAVAGKLATADEVVGDGWRLLSQARSRR
jgi:uncharacterized membrane protein YccC